MCLPKKNFSTGFLNNTYILANLAKKVKPLLMYNMHMILIKLL